LAAKAASNLPPIFALASAIALAAIPATVSADVSVAPPRIGAPGMLESNTGSLLVQYYETFLDNQDIETFRVNAITRYTEGTLSRLIGSGSVQARRAAVLALGLSGTFASNAAVGRALKDSDRTVRQLANEALWAIWFRADSPENNKTLEQVSKLVVQRPEQAVTAATRLIDRAPNFAEAYNQRAIAYFVMGQFEQSAADCRRVLERNPYHFGALGGLAQCQIQLGQRSDALKTLRRALKLQPYSLGLRETVDALESEGN
jgi:tetratricopeptide (TPR) repeat protein